MLVTKYDKFCYEHLTIHNAILQQFQVMAVLLQDIDQLL